MSIPHDIASNEKSVTFSGKNSNKNDQVLLNNPNYLSKSPNHSSSTKEVRNSS